MKEIIEYYYNLQITDIEELDGKYHFKIGKKDYFFVYYNRLDTELEDILKCTYELRKRNVDCHQIYYNITNEVLTKVDNYNYILFSVNNLAEEYSILEIVEMNKKLILTSSSSNLYRNNWAELWISKVDYFEYQIRELGLNKSNISNTFSYYIGLAENAISYVNNTNKKYQRTNDDHIVLAHRRIFYPNIKLNYLNPLSFVFDLEVRDVAEYLKAMFFNNNSNDVIIELETYLKMNKLSIYGYQMLFARLLYPSYYFDIYENIMNKQTDDDRLVKIISLVDDYESFLKKAYLEISKYAPIEKIDWLIN